MAAAPADLVEAYEVHKQVAESVGRVGAFKTARSPTDPQVIAPIFARDIQYSPGAASCHGRETIGVELEVAFIVTAPLPPSDAPDFADKAKGCVAPLCVMEIVEGRLEEPDDVPALVKLADNQVNAGLVTGAPVHDWQDLDLTNVEAAFNLDGKDVFNGPAQVPGGDAFVTFCGAAKLIDQYWTALSPGQVVITGALNGLFVAKRGTTVRGRIAGLGEVRADLIN